MRKKYASALSVLSFLLVFTALIPVVVNGWANPLATDPPDDGNTIGDDILSVDAQLANDFVYVRFKMNAPLIDSILYAVWVDFDKNISTGSLVFDFAWDLAFVCQIDQISPDLQVRVRVDIGDFLHFYVAFNMTANNGTAIGWSDLSLVPYFDLPIFANGSHGDVAFGVNWVWLTTQMALQNVTGDGISMYLVFEAGSDTDRCPDQTGGATDYIEWKFSGDDGISGFSAPLALFCLLNVLAVMILRDRKRVTF